VSTSAPFHAPKTALITGASSGIGLELAHLFARDGYRLVLLARNRNTLRQIGDDLQARYSITVRIAPKDLAHPASPDELYRELQEAGPFAETNWTQEAEMMQVNVVAATHLTKLFLPQIRARQGKVLNVASTAAFQPGPFMAVYYATKAYLLSFSEALAEELDGSGVTVTCLCPGPVKTNFQKRAYLEGTGMMNSPLMVDVQEVARVGYEGMNRGTRLVIPGWKNRVGIQMLRLSPRAAVTKIVRKMQEKKNS
jgi:short-subunit dehydrogenase